MSDKEKELLLEMMKYFTFELHRGIKEYGGASNFKTEEACNVIFKILYQYDVNIIDVKTHKDLEKEIETLTNIIKSARDLFYEKCRISQNGVYTFNQVDYKELDNVLKGVDKE